MGVALPKGTIKTLKPEMTKTIKKAGTMPAVIYTNYNVKSSLKSTGSDQPEIHFWNFVKPYRGLIAFTLLLTARRKFKGVSKLGC